MRKEVSHVSGDLDQTINDKLVKLTNMNKDN